MCFKHIIPQPITFHGLTSLAHQEFSILSIGQPCGPLSPSEGINHLLTIVDRFTLWHEVIPLPYASATTVTRVFIRHWVASSGVQAVHLQPLG